MKDFILFRRMVTPYIIVVIYWLIVILLLLYMVYATVVVFNDGANTLGIVLLCIAWPIGLPAGILIIRIYTEMLILLFRINETLMDIKASLQLKKPE